MYTQTQINMSAHTSSPLPLLAIRSMLITIFQSEGVERKTASGTEEEDEREGGGGGEECMKRGGSGRETQRGLVLVWSSWRDDL